MSVPEECDHDDDEYELVRACRKCGGVEIITRSISTSSSVAPGIFTHPQEKMSGYYCLDCQDFTMASIAERCPECGFVDWVYTMDEEIFGD